MNTLRRDGAEWTGHAGLQRAHTQGDLCRGVIDGTRLEVQHGGLREQTSQDGCGWCRDASGLLLPLRMSLGQRSVCVPIASAWSRMGREIYKVEPRRMPRYSRASYHQKGPRTGFDRNQWQPSNRNTQPMTKANTRRHTGANATHTQASP